MLIRKITFLLDKKNDWIQHYLKNYINKFPKKYKYTISKNPRKIKNKIVFVLSYTKILGSDFLNNNAEVLIIHPSKLPKDKGFSPVQNQVLRNQNLIDISLLRASEEVDAGPIAIRDTFLLKGDELSDEIRKKQASAIFLVIKKFLAKYPNIQYRKQIGVGSFNKRRTALSNELNINKSIKSQFNLLRIVDNKLYPAFFKYKKKIYYIYIKKK
jgi:methionyl-tRNA formyltransferase